MGRWWINRVSNFAYPCRICGEKRESACMADICAQLDLKKMQEKERHLVPLKGNEHLVKMKENG